MGSLINITQIIEILKWGAKLGLPITFTRIKDVNKKISKQTYSLLIKLIKQFNKINIKCYK
jgi:hypothetical protein